MAQTTVNFNLKTAGFANYANQTLTFRLLTAGADKTDDTVTLAGVVTATSAANGTGSVALFTNGDSDINSIFEVIFPNREKAKFLIPAGTSSIHLSDLLVDHVPGGSDTQQSSVYAEAIKRANHTGSLSLDSLPNGSITGTLAVANGGTNASTASAARTSLGLGTIATQASNSVDIDGGAIDATVIGANSAAAGTFAALTSSSVDINGGAIDGVVIGANSSAAGTFSTLIGPTTNLTGSGDNQFISSAELTKLNTIDADVTTLSLPASTTISTFAKTFLDDADAAAVKSTLGIADTSAIAGFVPKSITFPSASDFLSIADDNDLDVGTGDFTLSFWARLDGNGTEPILNKYSGAGYSLKFSSGELILTIQGTGDPLAVTLATGLNDNKWHVYVVSVDRDANAVAYVDNVAQTARDVSTIATSLDNTTAFRIGYDGANPSSEIAFGNYVALHKSALTASEAAQIYFSADAALTAVVPTLMVDLRRADKTFTDVSASPLAIVTNGTVRFNQDRITSLDGVGDINCSSISSDVAATGLNVIFDGTDTGDNKITLTDNLASALDITESTNSYLKFTTTNTGEKVVLGKDLDISGDHDLIIGTSTGTKIGTAATQKIGFFNATPVVQQTAAALTTGTSGGSGTALHTNATITGNVGSTAYTVGDIVKALKTLGLLAE
jgi:hypothetical protein